MVCGVFGNHVIGGHRLGVSVRHVAANAVCRVYGRRHFLGCEPSTRSQRPRQSQRLGVACRLDLFGHGNVLCPRFHCLGRTYFSLARWSGRSTCAIFGLCECGILGRRECLADQRFGLCHSRFWQHENALLGVVDHLFGASSFERSFGLGLGAYSEFRHGGHCHGIGHCF